MWEKSWTIVLVIFVTFPNVTSAVFKRLRSWNIRHPVFNMKYPAKEKSDIQKFGVRLVGKGTYY